MLQALLHSLPEALQNSTGRPVIDHASPLCDLVDAVLFAGECAPVPVPRVLLSFPPCGSALSWLRRSGSREVATCGTGEGGRAAQHHTTAAPADTDERGGSGMETAIDQAGLLTVGG